MCIKTLNKTLNISARSLTVLYGAALATPKVTPKVIEKLAKRELNPYCREELKNCVTILRFNGVKTLKV